MTPFLTSIRSARVIVRVRREETVARPERGRGRLSPTSTTRLMRSGEWRVVPELARLREANSFLKQDAQNGLPDAER